VTKATIIDAILELSRCSNISIYLSVTLLEINSTLKIFANYSDIIFKLYKVIYPHIIGSENKSYK